MWRTECGDRILEGAEAIVFAETLLSLLDDAIMGQFDDYELGVACFDNLTYGQKSSVLATIGNGLFRKDILPVEVNYYRLKAVALKPGCKPAKDHCLYESPHRGVLYLGARYTA